MVVAVALLLVSSCGPASKVARDAEVHVGGRIVDGRAALADAVVRMRVEPTGQQRFGGALLAFGTVGLSCAAGIPGELCTDNVRSATTDDEGRFGFDVTGEDVQDGLGVAQDVSFTVDAAPRGSEVSGPAVDASTLVQATRVELGALAMWRPTVRFSSRGPATARVEWSAAPRALAGVTGYRVVFDDARGGVAWEQAGGSTVTFDARVLEGTVGGVSVVAQGKRTISGAVADVRYRSPRLPYESGFTPPPSRGAACRTASANGEGKPDGQGRRPEWVRPCPLTDGDFAALEPLTRAKVLDLGRALEVSLVVVRGCAATCRVEGSPDGRRWTPLTTVNDEYGTFAPDPRPASRYLRVGGTGAMTELSVWEGDPRPVAGGVALRRPKPDTVPVHEWGDGGGGVPGWVWLALGAVAIAVLAGAAGIALGRRTRNRDVSAGQDS